MGGHGGDDESMVGVMVGTNPCTDPCDRDFSFMSNLGSGISASGRPQKGWQNYGGAECKSHLNVPTAGPAGDIGCCHQQAMVSGRPASFRGFIETNLRYWETRQLLMPYISMSSMDETTNIVVILENGYFIILKIYVLMGPVPEEKISSALKETHFAGYTASLVTPRFNYLFFCSHLFFV